MVARHLRQIELLLSVQFSRKGYLREQSQKSRPSPSGNSELADSMRLLRGPSACAEYLRFRLPSTPFFRQPARV